MSDVFGEDFLDQIVGVHWGGGIILTGYLVEKVQTDWVGSQPPLNAFPGLVGQVFVTNTTFTYLPPPSKKGKVQPPPPPLPPASHTNGPNGFVISFTAYFVFNWLPPVPPAPSPHYSIGPGVPNF